MTVIDSILSLAKKGIKILTEDVVYKLIEEISEFREEKAKEIEKRRLMQLTTICKIKILHQFVFRNTSPAIFGARVEAGKLKKDLNLIDENGEKVGRVKNVQSDNKSIDEAEEGLEIAMSIPGVNFERVLSKKDYLYTDLGESQFRTFKKNKDLLSAGEMNILKEIAEIKRKEKPEWGM